MAGVEVSVVGKSGVNVIDVQLSKLTRSPEEQAEEGRGIGELGVKMGRGE